MKLIDRLFPNLLGFGAPSQARTERLQSLSEQAVRRLYDAAAAKRAKRIEKVLPEDADDWLANSLNKHLIRAEKARRKIKTDDLKRLIRLGQNDGPDAVKAETEKLRLPTDVGWETMMRGYNPGVANTHRTAFGDKDRLYFDLPQAGDHPTGHQLAICHWLDLQGFTDVDYADGKATAPDGKRRRIGRALGPRPDLLRAYSDDPGRARDKLMVVISRDPVDIARMSTGRGWVSCMAADGEYADYLPREIAGGTIIAYLAKKSDPDLNDPLGRMLIKPHVEQLYRTVTMLPDNVYGIGHPALQDIAWQFAQNHFHRPDDMPGQVELARGLYNDNLSTTRTILPAGKLTAEQALNALMVPYKKDAAGKITVNGGVDLGNMGLTELPDFSGVTVKGYFNCAGNRLTSLKGAPDEVTLYFNASKNRLVTLEGVPKIGRWIKLSDNQLTSLEGCQQNVQGSFDVSNNPLVTLDGAPRKIGHNLNLTNTLLDSWEGGPDEVGLEAHAGNTAIRTKDGAPKTGMGVFIDEDSEPIKAAGPRF
ncbi:MAG: hypothetical protein Alpg2KO_28710 [Alphaproteobacteria bacterium]